MKKWKDIMEALNPRSKTLSSQMFVSFNVTATMRTAGLSRQSTREIIRISIGSLLVLGLLFIVVYTILLAYVDNKFSLQPYDDKAWHMKRVKFVGKKMKSVDSLEYVWQYEIVPKRKIAWNTTEFYGDTVEPHCKSQTTFRVIITSAPKNRHRRKAIRDTWCKPENFKESSHSWHCIFLISRSDSESLNRMVREERDYYNDILLGSYIDSYRNLTYKVVHGFSWVVNHCPSHYIIKTDDDCFVNGGVILNFLRNHTTVVKNLYAGSFILKDEKLRVLHGTGTKWSVPYKEYPYDYYPPYASGIGYILSIDSAKRFVHEVNFIKPIANEDAFMGIVMSRIGVKPTVSSRFLLTPIGLTTCNFRYVMICHGVEAEKQLELMKTVTKSKTLCKGVDREHTWS